MIWTIKWLNFYYIFLTLSFIYGKDSYLDKTRSVTRHPIEIKRRKHFLVPYWFNRKGTLGLPSVRLSVPLSVLQSVHKTGSRDNAKSTKNIFMKLDIWIDGSMEIMHIFFFFLCWIFWFLWQQIVWKYGKFNPVITEKVLKIFLWNLKYR
jgi:hypothetical protein